MRKAQKKGCKPLFRIHLLRLSARFLHLFTKKTRFSAPENLSLDGINTFFLLMTARRCTPIVGKICCQRGCGLRETPLFRLIGTKRHTRTCCHSVKQDSRKAPVPLPASRRKRARTRHDVGEKGKGLASCLSETPRESRISLRTLTKTRTIEPHKVGIDKLTSWSQGPPQSCLYD